MKLQSKKQALIYSAVLWAAIVEHCSDDNLHVLSVKKEITSKFIPKFKNNCPACEWANTHSGNCGGNCIIKWGNGQGCMLGSSPYPDNPKGVLDLILESLDKLNKGE